MEEEYCDSPDEHYQQDKSTASNTGSTPREHSQNLDRNPGPFWGGWNLAKSCFSVLANVWAIALDFAKLSLYFGAWQISICFLGLPIFVSHNSGIFFFFLVCILSHSILGRLNFWAFFLFLFIYLFIYFFGGGGWF